MLSPEGVTMPDHLPLPGDVTAPPPPGCATWVDPPGPPALLEYSPLHAASRFEGRVEGAWGGHCGGLVGVASAERGFDAELALQAGDAVNAQLRGGGHRRDWVWVDDPGLPSGQPVEVVLRLSLEGRLSGRIGPRRGWGADPGGEAFVGSENHDRQPLRLRLVLDTGREGRSGAEGGHPLLLPNRCWSALPMRFAVRLHSSLEQALHWQVRARIAVVAPAGAPVRCRHAGASAAAAKLADHMAGPVPWA